MRFCVPVLLSLVMLASCHAAAPKPAPVIKPPVIAPPVVQPAFLSHLPMPGETLPLGPTTVYAGNLPIGKLINDGKLFGPPNAPGDTGIWWTLERDSTGLRQWRACGDTAWVVSQAFGDGAPWRVGQ